MILNSAGGKNQLSPPTFNIENVRWKYSKVCALCLIKLQVYISWKTCRQEDIFAPQQMFHLAAFLLVTLVLDACALPSDIHIHLHKDGLEGGGPTMMGKDYENGGKSDLKYKSAFHTH